MSTHLQIPFSAGGVAHPVEDAPVVLPQSRSPSSAGGVAHPVEDAPVVLQQSRSPSSTGGVAHPVEDALVAVPESHSPSSAAGEVHLFVGAPDSDSWKLPAAVAGDEPCLALCA